MPKHLGWSISSPIGDDEIFLCLVFCLLQSVLYLVNCKARPEKVFQHGLIEKVCHQKSYLCLHLYLPEYICIYLDIFVLIPGYICINTWIYLNVFSHLLNLHPIMLEKDFQQWPIKKGVITSIEVPFQHFLRSLIGNWSDGMELWRNRFTLTVNDWQLTNVRLNLLIPKTITPHFTDQENARIEHYDFSNDHWWWLLNKKNNICIAWMSKIASRPVPTLVVLFATHPPLSK